MHNIFGKILKITLIISIFLVTLGSSTLLAKGSSKSDKQIFTYPEVMARIELMEKGSDPGVICENMRGADVCYRRQGDLIEGVAGIEVSLPPKDVKEILSNYDNHDIYFKDVSGSKVIKRDGKDKWWFYQRIHVPVVDDREFIVLVNDVGDAFYWYYLGAGEIKEGSLSGGNMKSASGAWVFEKEKDPNKCKVKFYLYSQPLSSKNLWDNFVPDFVLSYMAKETFPATVIAVRDIVQNYDEWFDKEGNLRPEKRLASKQ